MNTGRRVYMHKKSGNLFLEIVFPCDEIFCVMKYGDNSNDFSIFFTDHFECLGDL